MSGGFTAATNVLAFTRQRFRQDTRLHLFDCIECGCCDYVCPSQIPLVHYFRYAKTEIWAAQKEKALSDIARERHQFREVRLEREKLEKQARHKAKRAALDAKKGAPKDSAADAKKAAIQAAMDRAQKKRDEAAPKNTDNLTADQQKKIDEANTRRAATRAEITQIKAAQATSIDKPKTIPEKKS